MARTIAVFALAVAIVASVFAIWPVVTDAPWEDSAAPIVAPARQPSRCEVLTQQLADARTERAAFIIYELGQEREFSFEPGSSCW